VVLGFELRVRKVLYPLRNSTSPKVVDVLRCPVTLLFHIFCASALRFAHLLSICWLEVLAA
jgi:hypothetical protein